jgi:hypothetical protein
MDRAMRAQRTVTIMQPEAAPVPVVALQDGLPPSPPVTFTGRIEGQRTNTDNLPIAQAISEIQTLSPQAQDIVQRGLESLVLNEERLARRQRRTVEPPPPINLANARRGFGTLLQNGATRPRAGQGPANFRVNLIEREPAPIHAVSLIQDDGTIVTGVNVAYSCRCGRPSLDPGVICPECRATMFVPCSEPGCTELVDTYETDGRTPLYCPTHWDMRMAQCRDCGTWTPRAGLRGDRCVRCRPRAPRVIQWHDHKPDPRFYHLNGESTRTPHPGTIYFGVELETEWPTHVDREEIAGNIIAAANGLVYPKHDGSLNHGIEFVTHPFSFGWLVANKDKVLSLLACLRDAGGTSYETETCGMHIHISRAGMTQDARSNLMRLAQQNPKLLLKLSRRKETNLLRWAKYLDNPGIITDVNRRGWESPDRYTALNVTEHTIEFRIFRGTIADAGFLGNIEAVKSMCDYASVAHLRDGAARFTAADYEAYVDQNEADYPNLRSAILRRLPAPQKA